MPHVFISYVRENSEEVDRLATELKKAGVTVWLDRNSIEPGARWQDAIEKAIQTGKFFIACFSREYTERERTHMLEELNVAVEEIRQRHQERIWFIPVLINNTYIPPISIRHGKKLTDFNAIKLYEDWDVGIYRILRVLQYDNPVFARIAHLVEMCERPFDNERLHAIRQLSDIGKAAKPALFAVLRAAKDSNSEIRRASLEALGKIATSDAVPVLAAALNDDSASAVAALALAKIGPDAVPTLIAALKNPRARSHASMALDMIGLPAVPALAAALNDINNFDGRSWAAVALSRIGRDAAGAVPALTAALDDPDHSVRFWAARALGEIGVDAAVAMPALTAALDDPDHSVRQSVLEAQVKIRGSQKS